MSTAPAPLLVLVLLATAGAAAPPDMGPRDARARPIQLSAQPYGTKPELRISPTDSTVVLFDAPLAGAEVEVPERFRRVRVAGDTLTLVPAGGLMEGTRVKLTVSFLDGATPERVELVLVVDASAEPQVEVHRRLRPQEPPSQEEALREENQRLRQEVQRLRGTSVLIRLLADGRLNENNLAVRRMDGTRLKSPGSPLRVHSVLAFRVGAQVALVLELENQDATRPWQAGDAALEREGSPPKALSVWAEAPLAPGEQGRVVVGAEVTKKEALGTFTVTVREAGGGPALTLGGLTFP